MIKNVWLSRVMGEAQDAPAIPAEAEPVEDVPAAEDAPPPEEPVDVEQVPSAQVVDTLVQAWQAGGRNDVAAQLLFTPVSYADFVLLCFKLGQGDAVELGHMLDELAESEGMVTDIPGENKLFTPTAANEPEKPGEMVDTYPDTR